ncbi:MAG TPA: cation:proton antiporter [Solirubrobacteraceae bacterium]|nr:cation:proton antiporter [Solirubrobacteraceae bacterium]
MEAWSLAAVAGIMLAYIALQTWRPRVLAPAIAFTAAGLVVGAEGLRWIEVSPRAGSFRLLAEATLALVLFSDASRIDLRALRDGYAVPARLLGIGLPLPIVAGTLVALVVLPDLVLAEAVVLAIVLAATDAGAGGGDRRAANAATISPACDSRQTSIFRRLRSSPACNMKTGLLERAPRSTRGACHRGSPPSWQFKAAVSETQRFRSRGASQRCRQWFAERYGCLRRPGGAPCR